MTWMIRMEADLPSLNTWISKYWKVRWTDKDAVGWLVRQAVLETPDLPRPITARVDIRVIAYNQTHIKDADNLPDKSIVDGLRYAQVLEEDTSACVRWVCRRLDVDGGQPYVTIQLTEVDGE